MLLRFGVSNFTSIRDFQELSLVAGPLSDDPNRLVSVENFPLKVLRLAAIFGANASGKSNILGAIAFLSGAVRNSQSKWEPGAKINRRPFALDNMEGVPTEFSAEFIADGTRFEYGFSIHDTFVHTEYLFAFPANRRQVWFERNSEWPHMRFGKNLTGENRAIESLTRPDSLFLSAARQSNHEKLRPVYTFLAEGVRYRSGLPDRQPTRTIAMCVKDESTKNRVLSLLRIADLGIDGIDIEEEPPDEDSGEFSKKLRALIKEFSPDFPSESRPRRSISLRHVGRSGAVPISISRESDGTLAYLGLLGPILQTLDSGGVLCVDELDASLHPLLLAEIIRIFSDSGTNRHGAQLIFNTHATDLLRDGTVRRDEVWFTEKDAKGATRLYPLSDFKPRREENLQRGYLQGRYGATPVLDVDAVEDAIDD